MNVHPQSYIVRGFHPAGESALSEIRAQPLPGLSRAGATGTDSGTTQGRSCGCAGEGCLGWRAVNGPEME